MLEHIKIAVLDLYNGVANEGLRCIKTMLVEYEIENHTSLDWKVFDVRGKNEIPDLSYDIFISSGGPGSPIESDLEEWDIAWCKLMDDLWAYNKHNERKKYVFLICHSFQMFCRHHKLANISKRKSTSFGIFPVTKTELGLKERFFDSLSNPFYVVDSRDWQATEPNEERVKEMGAKVLVLEKERPHVDLERAIMAIRFSNEIVGTQFHPETDAAGMNIWLRFPEKKEQIIKDHGVEKYEEMLALLQRDETIKHTQQTILPEFLARSIQKLQLVH